MAVDRLTFLARGKKKKIEPIRWQSFFFHFICVMLLAFKICVRNPTAFVCACVRLLSALSILLPNEVNVLPLQYLIIYTSRDRKLR